MLPVIGVDIGNSAIKLGIPNDSGTLCRHRMETVGPQFQPDLQTPHLWSICSVNSQSLSGLSSWIEGHRPNDSIHVISADDIPIKTNIQCREKAGRDRLVAAWNAWDIYAEELVIIDAGTAVTIDYVDDTGVFQGGVIFPGARSSLKLLASSTHDLPNLLNRNIDLDDLLLNSIGKGTETAILRGVYQSQMSAIKTIADGISDSARIVATGGEIEFLSSLLPDHWTIDPLLVVQGAEKIGSMIASEQ